MRVKSRVSCHSPSSWPKPLPARLVNTCLSKTPFVGFKGIIEGEYDHLPEQAFYMVGSIEEAVEQGQENQDKAAERQRET